MPIAKSPYSASFTAASLMLNETKVVAAMLLEDNSKETKKKLKEDAQYLKIKSVAARDRVTIELAKRFDTMAPSFWREFLEQPEDQQRVSLFYVVLKTYKLLFEFQVNVALPKFNSIDRAVDLGEVLMALNEIAANDEYVDGWTDETRKKIASTYLTMLKQAGMINESTGELQEPAVSDDYLAQYIRTGEMWFLQACFFPQYKIEQIKQLAI